MTWEIYHGDCRDVMDDLDPVDAIVSDPPYGLEFMNRGWDHGVPTAQYWKMALECAKPGAHMLAFGGTRTYHRLACAIEDAGWEIRDCLMWLYGSGFKKGLDIGKAIDELKGETREVVGRDKRGSKDNASVFDDKNCGYEIEFDLTKPKSKEAIQWDGWHTGLTPAWEPIILARKPIPTTIAKNVLEYGTGGINVDGCRIETTDTYKYNKCGGSSFGINRGIDGTREAGAESNPLGRWPKNVILDEESAAMLDAQSGISKSVVRSSEDRDELGATFSLGRTGTTPRGHNDQGGASRFFYTAKSSKSEREGGLAHMQDTTVGDGRQKSIDNAYQRGQTKRKNTHPTVKPINLMRYLVRLVTPPGGTVLDPFAGSGSTIVAAKIEGFNGIGIEKEKEYVNIARHRVEHARYEAQQIGLFDETHT
jgi:site-specific DNA-methyltransferase (adenine-specific)